MSIYHILNATHLYLKNRTYLWLFIPLLPVVYAQWTNVWLFNYSGVVIELLCSYWTNEKAYIESIRWAILVYGNHVLPKNCPLCTSSVRPLPHTVIFCRRTLHLCDRYPFRLLVKSVSAVSGRDIMVEKLLLYFLCVCVCVCVLLCFFMVLICFLFCFVYVWLFVCCCFCFLFLLKNSFLLIV